MTVSGQILLAVDIPRGTAGAWQGLHMPARRELDSNICAGGLVDF